MIKRINGKAVVFSGTPEMGYSMNGELGSQFLHSKCKTAWKIFHRFCRVLDSGAVPRVPYTQFAQYLDLGSGYARIEGQGQEVAWSIDLRPDLVPYPQIWNTGGVK